MIKVLIVDDSPVVRKMYRRILGAAPDCEVIGEAGDPFEARDLIVAAPPDVVLLDIEMPRMDGITFLKRLMVHHPVPVLICSSLTERGSQKALDAMDAGAVEVICKPNPNYTLANMARDLVTGVRVAARATPRGQVPRERAGRVVCGAGDRSHQIIAVGASTGGTVAIEDLLGEMPVDIPPILVTQHMPAYMSAAFADRVNRLAAIRVREAQDGDRLEPGLALIAPGGRHLTVQGSRGNFRARITDTAQVNGHRPSVDVLFHSVARAAHQGAVGIILTGMGRDGADGLLAMRQAGGYTFAQDAASCVVFGMPKAAIELGAVDEISSLRALPERLLRTLADRMTLRPAPVPGRIREAEGLASHNRLHGSALETGHRDPPDRESH
jgi:two-component system chemotaxis response regulator CheB